MESCLPVDSGIKSEEQEAYFREDAQAFKNEINIPLILVGGIRSLEVAERLVEDGVADYLSMSRPFIREPALINRWKAGDRRQSAVQIGQSVFRPGAARSGYILCYRRTRKGPTVRRCDPLFSLARPGRTGTCDLQIRRRPPGPPRSSFHQLTETSVAPKPLQIKRKLLASPW